MEQSLFRSEVMEARQTQWLGNIRIGRPLSFTVVTAAAVVMAGALIAFACWGEITRKSTVHGVLLPVGGLLHVSAQQAGVISELLVAEGDQVVGGQPLARLRTDGITQSGDPAELTAQALRARKASLDAERRLTELSLRRRQDSIAQRLQGLSAELRQAQGELETVKLGVQLARQRLQRQQELAGAGLLAAAQVQVKEEELLDLQLLERNAERSLQALSRDLQTARVEEIATDAQAQTSLAQLDRAVAALDQESSENDSRNGLALKGPPAGHNTALPANAGQTVQAGQTVSSIALTAPDGRPAELQAQLYAPSRAAGFARPGREVYLCCAPYPFRKYGTSKGKVLAVSRGPIAPQGLPTGRCRALVAVAQSNGPPYPITVKLASQAVTIYGTATSLRVEEGVEAGIRQEAWKISEWPLESAFTFAGIQPVS